MTSQQPPQRRDSSWIALLASLFAVFNFMAMSTVEGAESETLAALVVGAFAAQLGLVAIWAALGPPRWMVRLPLTLMVAFLLFGAIFCGIMVAEDVPSFIVRHMARSFLMLPMVVLAAQLPLWILRVAIGCRIVLRRRGAPAETAQKARAEAPEPPERSDAPAVSPKYGQFGVQHLLGAMAVLAIALGLASMAPPAEYRARGDDFWTRLMIVCVVVSVWSGFSTLPCLWAAFRAPEKLVAAMGIGAYVIVMSFVVIAIVDAFDDVYDFPEAMGMLLLFHGSLAGVMLGMLHVARSCGYALVRPKRSKPPGVEAGCPFANPSDPSPSEEDP